MDSSTGRYPIDFDTWVHRVMAKEANLKREPDVGDGGQGGEEKSDKIEPVVEPLEVRVAHVSPQGGTLVEGEGRPLGLILDAVRFLVGSVLHQDPDIQGGLIDIEQLRRDGQHDEIKSLMTTAWQHWEDATPYSTPDNRNVYQLVQQFFDELPQANAGHNMPTEFYTAMASLKHRRAVGGWKTRVEGEFWVVSCSEETGGTYLVSKANANLVFEVFGVRGSLRRVADPDRPTLIATTLLPWYGRLVCDEPLAATTEVAEEEMVKELNKTVQLAKEEGRVVETLRQLDLPEQEEESQQSSVRRLTPTEGHFLGQLLDIPIANPDEAVWCMRRRGYTEYDNPHHMGIIINGVSGVAVGPFSCSALAPVASDIFQALVAYCGEDDKELPSVLLVDDLKCFERVALLLKGFPIDVQYYPPPTQEETEAALSEQQ